MSRCLASEFRDFLFLTTISLFFFLLDFEPGSTTLTGIRFRGITSSTGFLGRPSSEIWLDPLPFHFPHILLQRYPPPKSSVRLGANTVLNFSCCLFSSSLEHTLSIPAYKTVLLDALELIERRTGKILPPGRNESIRVIRLTLGQSHSSSLLFNSLQICR